MIAPQLNLLTSQRRQSLRHEALLVIAERYILMLILFFLLAAVILYALSFMLKRELSSQQARTRDVVAETISEQGELPQERIRQLNATLNRIASLQKGYVKWTPILRAVTEAVPDGITLTEMELDQTTHALSLKGTAATRNDLLNLQKSMNTSSVFRNPSTPVSNLLERENITFTMTADVVLP